MKTINGTPVASTRIYKEGEYWRWLIRDITGKEYVDSGNYWTEQAAYKGLSEALSYARAVDPNSFLKESRQRLRFLLLIRNGGYNGL